MQERIVGCVLVAAAVGMVVLRPVFSVAIVALAVIAVAAMVLVPGGED